MLTPERVNFFVNESNRIEGIDRPPRDEEIKEFYRFLDAEVITISDLQRFCSVYQPGARLRDQPGLDVYVGNHMPPRGGIHIREKLQSLLNDIHKGDIQPWEAHCQYETLHPFTDCNGRTGRMLWYWMMVGKRTFGLGFLHAFYYQSLQNFRQ